MCSYPARFTREGKAIVVAVPDIPEAITNGYSEAEAIEFAVDAIEVVLAEYIRLGREIPRPSKPKPGMKIITLPALTQAKLSLYTTLRASGITKAALARRLGWHKTQVERLLDLSHSSRMDQLEAAFRALGKSLEVRVRSAA